LLISLRSQLVAGTAAVIGAGSVAVAGVHQPLPALPASPTVALAAFNNPIEQLLGTLELGQNYLLGTYFNGGDAPTPGAGEANWPFAGFGQTGGDFLNFALYNEITLGNYSSVGLLPQLTNQANPIIRQLTTNLYTYINAALSGTIAAVSDLSAGVWNYPAAAVDALELALNGQISEAITVLTDAVVTPIVDAGQALFDTAAFVVTDFLAKTVAVLEVIPVNLAMFAGAAFGSAAVLADRSVQIATAWVDSLAAGDWEGAWNVAVNGLLGPSGLPGTALNLTIGAGVQTGPIINPETDIAENFVPSFRTATQATIWNTQNALTATAPPTAAVQPAAAEPEVPEAKTVAVPRVETAAPGSAGSDAVVPASPASEAVDSAIAGQTAGQTGGDPKPVRSHRAGKRAAKAVAGD
jgi:hypothetical protein